ncbi:hypothetical protein ACVWWO_000982 [Bradyrhizobium sp. F1.13.1]
MTLVFSLVLGSAVMQELLQKLTPEIAMLDCWMRPKKWLAGSSGFCSPASLYA